MVPAGANCTDCSIVRSFLLELQSARAVVETRERSKKR